MALDDTAYTDMPAVPEGGVVMPGNVAPGMTTDAQQAATEPQLTAAVGQLNAGQPVTALPHQTWSLQQAQAWNAKLGDYDRRANAARIASEQAARDAALLDQMSRVAKSTKDIEVAMQQLDVQRFRNDVANGIPALQALQRSPRAATSPLVAAIKANEPIAAPTLVPPNAGTPGYVVDPRGTPHFWPGQEPSMAAPKPEDVGGGVSILRVSPQHFQVVTKPPPTPKEGSLNDTQKATLTDLRREETAIRSTLPSRVTNPAYIAATNRLAEIKASRDAILNSAPVSGGSSSVAVTGQGTKDDPALPQNETQMKSIPSGSIYRDPKSGKLFRKK